MKDNKENVIDDSKELITIDYYDRINKKWIEVEVTKEVARFMKADTQQRRRKQNQYDHYNKSFDVIFNEDKPENERFLVDESADIEKELISQEEEILKIIKIEHERALIENALTILTPEQKEVIEMVMYRNMSYNEIAKELGIDKSSVYARMKNAKKNIKNFIKNTEN